MNTQKHYKGPHTIYWIAQQWGLNSYEFDIIKRIIRCRHKGQFTQDLQKTKELIDIYLHEYGESNNETEAIRKRN